ncbi:MAG: hypothetical protein K0Q46_6471 [Rhodococcus erythropolis]|jgi:hypothetical protein|nr:hypothetical protein [Rhodococcus erythropolis]MDF2899685.1 hypothetical protein [Rhodococcus erythropolis]
MSIEIRYRCCEHCIDDPIYHADEPADSHTTSCSISGRGCPVGDQRIQFDTETLAPVPTEETGR